VKRCICLGKDSSENMARRTAIGLKNYPSKTLRNLLFLFWRSYLCYRTEHGKIDSCLRRSISKKQNSLIAMFSMQKGYNLFKTLLLNVLFRL
jgi:hypothetical protein